ncbi:MAG: InlB B-repeat-containing protein [Clostridia bacterium]|nr:InlB B-repeat-containing protein [Clostridia bacterium]
MRKKFLIACLSLLICFSMVFGFSTKQFANAEDINIYTLTFVSNCDEVVPAITQEEKTPLTLPTLERDGYIFLGWYSDEEMTKYFVRTAMPSESYTLYAKWHFVFNVKNAENGVTVSSSVTGENTYENFDSALSQIVNYSTTNSLETAYILFEDFNLDSANNNSSIELTNNSVKYHFSGNISSSSSNGIVNFTSENAIDLTFENFNISCSNADYAVKFETTGNTFNIGGDIVYTSKYLSHFTKENTLNSTLLNLTSKVKITTPYFTNYDVIINLKNSLSKDYIEIVSENDSYVISQNYYGQGTTQYITANSKFNVEFDTNEGGFLPAYESTYTNYIQYYSDNFSLPKSEEVLKLNSFIVGWFGKFEHDSITYYFDSQTLENFKTVNYDLNEIANYFTTDLSELINDYSFDKYAHDSSGDFKEYEHLHFFLKNGKTPTYIAKWEYNSYNISFVTNESTIDCAQI